MSQFLSGLRDELRVMEEEIRNLPVELDSAVTRLDHSRLGKLFLRLDQDCDRLYDKHFDAQRSRVLASPFIIDPSSSPFIRLITSEDLARWRETYKSEVRVVMGKEGVGVIDVSELAREHQTTAPQVIHAAQEQGYIVLGWDDYQPLLAEIGSLIGEDEESPPGTIVGIPVPTTDSPQEVKILPKSSPL